MNRGNCLIRTRVEDPFQAIVLIDYEFAGYGHRGQDIGKHFYMHAIDVTDIANNMKSGLEYPKFEERENFCRAYLEETMKKMKKLAKYKVDEAPDGIDTVESVTMEAEFFAIIIIIMNFNSILS